MATQEGLEKARLRAEQRRMEEAMRESEAIFQELFESAPDAIVVVHSDGRIVRVNAQAETMFGYSRDELLGSPVEVLVPERFREQHLGHRMSYISEPRIRPMGSGSQLYGRRKDGSEFPADIMLNPLETKDGVQVVSIVRDVTERRRVEELTRRQRDELAVHARIVKATVQTSDLDERLNIILGEATSLLGVEFGGVHLVEGNRVILRAWRGISDEFRAQVMSFPVEQVPGWMETPHVVHERLSERSATPDFAKREGVQAWACVPLTVPQRSADGMGQGRWLGALMLGSRRYDALREDDVQVLRSLSDQLALAVDHARRYREAQERLWRLTVLREIDRAIIVKHSTRDILNIVLERVPKELGGDAVAISLLDENQLGAEVFVMRLPNGAVVEGEAFVLSDNLLHWFVKRRKPVIIYDLMKDPRLQMHRERIRDHNLVSYLGVPLVAQERTIGILHLLTMQPRIFSEEDVDFFHTLAGQAAIAIESVLLLDRVQTSEAHFQRLAENAQDIIYRYRFTPSRGFEYINPACTAITGYTPEEHYADPDLGFKIVHPDDRTLLDAIIRSPSSGGDPVVLRWIRKDGAVIWTEQRNIPIYDEAGNLIALEGIARDITERKQMEESLRQATGQMQALSRRLVEAQEEERRRIARELHDEVGQVLTGLNTLIEKGTHESVQKARPLIQELIARVRDMSLDLRPPILDDLGLLHALLWHFDRYTAQTGIRVDFRHTGLKGRRFAPEVETGVYRIAQEALTNAARHSGVSEVIVQVRADRGRLRVLVQDQGVGFDPDAALASGTTGGLLGMRERAALLGGQFSVESSPGAGACLTVELPLARVP